MPVKSIHRNDDGRPIGRSRLSLTSVIRNWLLHAPFIRRLVASARRLADPSVRIEVHAQADAQHTHEEGCLTIVSANLWHDWPRHRDLPERLESLAKLIEERGANVVLLQEALRIPGLSAGEWMAERLGMTQGYVRANGAESAIGFEEGPAVLSKLPVLAHQALVLDSSAGPLVRRMALGAQIKLGCCSIWAVSAHLGFLRGENRRQMAQLRSWVADLAGEGTAVIGGDFNAGEAAHSIDLARQHWQDTFRSVNPSAEGHTHLLRWPWGEPLRRQRLDYLFLKPGQHDWVVLDAQHLTTQPRPHSDHKAVLARIHYQPGSPSSN